MLPWHLVVKSLPHMKEQVRITVLFFETLCDITLASLIMFNVYVMLLHEIELRKD